MSWRDYREDVEPTPEDLDRVRARLDAARQRNPLLDQLVPVDPAAVARVRGRLRRRRSVRWWIPAAGIAMAAASLVWLLQPPPALDTSLHDAGAQALGDDVRVEFSGVGSVTGTTREPVIAWQTGTLQVDVTPGQGVDLHVRTEEGDVHVVGTRFSVARDRLGTAVAVDRGHVVVTCLDGQTHDLLAGTNATCLPTRAAGLLGRARALQEANADADVVLAPIDRALTLEPDPATRDELLALRASTLFDAGRPAEAAVDAALENPAAPRRPAMLRIKARLRLAAAGCEAALPWLDRIPAADRLVTDEIARADCLAATDPAAARAALQAALALTPAPALAARIHQRLAALGG